MNRQMVEKAARLLAGARKTGAPIEHLPSDAMPNCFCEAHAIQDETTAILGERIGAFKVAAISGEEVARGAIFSSLVHVSPATYHVGRASSLGVEVEIAFRLGQRLPPRKEVYQRAEVVAAIEACPAIEILGTRYRDASSISKMERLADHFGNGALIHGPASPVWQRLDTLHINVILEVDGERAVEAAGGHMTGDPSASVVALANHFRATTGLHEGT